MPFQKIFNSTVMLAERAARRRQATSSLPRHLQSDAHVNSAFVPDSDSGIFPSSPPPYSRKYLN